MAHSKSRKGRTELDSLLAERALFAEVTRAMAAQIIHLRLKVKQSTSALESTLPEEPPNLPGYQRIVDGGLESIINDPDPKNIIDPGHLDAAADDYVKAILLQSQSPCLLVEQGTINPAHSQRWKTRLERALPLIRAALPSVGRIEQRSPGGEFVSVGTGWMWSSGKLLTNRHVAHAFATKKPGPPGFRMENGTAYEARVNFCAEHAAASPVFCRVDRILFLGDGPDDEATDDGSDGNPNDDVAVLQLGDSPPDPLQMQLGDPSPDSLAAVIALGHPADDTSEQAVGEKRYLTALMLQRIYDVKRVAPGTAQLLFGSLLHDCTTFRNNSGSPLLSLRSGQVVGMHRAGLVSKKNYALPAAWLAKLLQGM